MNELVVVPVVKFILSLRNNLPKNRYFRAILMKFGYKLIVAQNVTLSTTQKRPRQLKAPPQETAIV